MSDRQFYKRNGYILAKGLFKPEELSSVREVASYFHELWLKDNHEFYEEKAINSAYLTGTKYLDQKQRKELFDLLVNDKVMQLLHQVIPESAVFMNTQLFFNPKKSNQKNYWHRDPQYHLNIEQQKQALKGPDVLHIRIPLSDEPGLELIPGSHVNWDSEEELAVRLEKDGRTSSEDLPNGLEIPLELGDALLFSANMIHRGLYGMNRFALDLLYFESDPEILKFVDQTCLPSEQELKQLGNPEVFLNAMHQGVN